MSKSVRLNKQMRGDILLSIKKQYKEITPPPFIMEDVQHKTALTFWKEAFGGVLSDFVLNKYSKFFNKGKTVKVSTETGTVHQFTLKEEFPLPDTGYNPAPILIVPGNHPALLNFQSAKDAIETYNEEYSIFRREASAIIGSVNTTGQLLEVWPEVEPFLPPHIADPSKGVKLPAIRTSRLNERLGISDVSA